MPVFRYGSHSYGVPRSLRANPIKDAAQDVNHAGPGHSEAA